jgi:hypothetical protein
MNTVPFEVTPLTEASYAVFRKHLERMIDRPEDFFFMFEDAENVIVRSVLGAMAQRGMHSASGSTDCRSTSCASCTTPYTMLPTGWHYYEET